MKTTHLKNPICIDVVILRHGQRLEMNSQFESSSSSFKAIAELQRDIEFEKSLSRVFINSASRTNNKCFWFYHNKKKTRRNCEFSLFAHFTEIEDLSRSDRLFTRICLMICSDFFLITKTKNLVAQERFCERQTSKSFCKKNIIKSIHRNRATVLRAFTTCFQRQEVSSSRQQRQKIIRRCKYL